MKLLLIVLACLVMAGCVSYRKCQTASDAIYKIGVAHGKAESAMERFNKLLSERPARQRALEIKASEDADKPFAQLADEAQCKTNEQFIADPNTPEDLRAIMEKGMAGCRTRKQERALDRIVDR